MKERCPTCNHRLASVGNRFAAELITFGLCTVPLAVAILIGHVPVWLTIWGCTGLAVVLLSWMYLAAREVSGEAARVNDKVTAINGGRRQKDHM